MKVRLNAPTTGNSGLKMDVGGKENAINPFSMFVIHDRYFLDWRRPLMVLSQLD